MSDQFPDPGMRAAVQFVIDSVIKNGLIEEFDKIERLRLNPTGKPLIHKGRKP